MIACFKNDKICSEKNKKCEECKLDDCKNTIKFIEEYENKEKENRIEQIVGELPTECQKCNIYEIIDSRNGKVYCSYAVGKNCIIEDYCENKKKKEKTI